MSIESVIARNTTAELKRQVVRIQAKLDKGTYRGKPLSEADIEFASGIRDIIAKEITEREKKAAHENTD